MRKCWTRRPAEWLDKAILIASWQKYKRSTNPCYSSSLILLPASNRDLFTYWQSCTEVQQLLSHVNFTLLWNETLEIDTMIWDMSHGDENNKRGDSCSKGHTYFPGKILVQVTSSEGLIKWNQKWSILCWNLCSTFLCMFFAMLQLTRTQRACTYQMLQAGWTFPRVAHYLWYTMRRLILRIHHDQDNQEWCCRIFDGVFCS